jgi:hypothetical protein
MIYNKKLIRKVIDNVCFPQDNIDWVDYFDAVQKIAIREGKAIICETYKDVFFGICSDTEYEEFDFHLHCQNVGKDALWIEKHNKE